MSDDRQPQVGDVFDDRDYLNYADTRPNGLDVPDGYEGPLSQRPRRVQVIAIDNDRAVLRNVRSGRVSKTKIDALRPQGKSRGFTYVGTFPVLDKEGTIA